MESAKLRFLEGFQARESVSRTLVVQGMVASFTTRVGGSVFNASVETGPPRHQCSPEGTRTVGRTAHKTALMMMEPCHVGFLHTWIYQRRVRS